VEETPQKAERKAEGRHRLKVAPWAQLELASENETERATPMLAPSNALVGRAGVLASPPEEENEAEPKAMRVGAARSPSARP